MDSIKMSRKEFCSLSVGLATIPIVIFLAGFYVGSTQQKVTEEPLLVETPNPELGVAVSDTPSLSDPLYMAQQAGEQDLFIDADMPIEMLDEVVALKEPTIVLASINPDQTQQHLFAVQVGNFSNLDNADVYKTKLQSKGVNAQVIGDASIESRATYRVVIGLFTDEKVAKMAADQHEFQQNQDAYVAMLF